MNRFWENFGVVERCDNDIYILFSPHPQLFNSPLWYKHHYTMANNFSFLMLNNIIVLRLSLNLKCTAIETCFI